MNDKGKYFPQQKAGLNPLLIGAQCERDAEIWVLAAGCLNPLLIGAQCELRPVNMLGFILSQSPFDRGSV